MSLLGRGILAIWNDVPAGDEGAFSHWHTKEHVPERVDVPGFHRGRRYLAVEGQPTFFTLYETDDASVLESPAYIARLNDPTPWTQRALRLFRNTNRTACQVTWRHGQGIGGVLATVRLAPLAGREAELRRWLTETALPAALEAPAIVGVALCEANLDATRVPTAERKLRDQEDEVAAWVLLVDGTDLDGVARPLETHVSQAALEQHGAAPGTARGFYRLLYALSRHG